MAEGIPHETSGIDVLAGESSVSQTITCPSCHQSSRMTVHVTAGVAQYTCPHCGHHGTIGSTKKEGLQRMTTDTTAPPTPRSVAALRQAAAEATSYAEQQRLITAAEEAQAQVLRAQAADRETDLAAQAITTITPVAVHELHTTATDWLATTSTSGDLRTATNAMLAQGSVWYQGLPDAVKAEGQEFAVQALGKAAHLCGAFGEHADTVEKAFLDHVATLRQRDERAGLFAQAGSPMPSQPGDPDGTFTTGGGQDWAPPEATSSNRAPQLQELAAPESQDLTEANDPGIGAGAPDPAVAAQERTASGIPLTPIAQHMPISRQAVDASDLEPFPRCAKCDQPVSPLEMAKTSKNEPVHGSCVGITGSNKEGQHMQTAPCPTCGNGRVAVRQEPQPSIIDIVAGKRTAYSGLPQIEQVVDPSDTNPAPTPLPPEVAFPWTIAPGQVENTIGEAEQQIAEREQRKGAALRAQAGAAATEAYRMAYSEVVRQTMARFDPQGSYDPQHRHASIHQHAQQLASAAANEATRLVMQGGQDDSGWLGDMGQGGVAPGQQDGGNPPSTNLGQPDPVYGYGGDNGNQPLKPYGADEADDFTNNPGMNYQPGQPLQNDLGGRGYSTDAPAGGAPKQSSLEEVEANDPQLQRAAAYMRNRRAYLRGQFAGK